MSDLLTQILEQSADAIQEKVSQEITRLLNQAFKSQIKIVFDETEAAEFLKVSKKTLENYRKLGLINYSMYPPAVREFKTDSTGAWKNAIYTYDLADLLNFRANYKIRKVAGNFELSENVSVFGPRVEEKPHLKKVS